MSTPEQFDLMHCVKWDLEKVCARFGMGTERERALVSRDRGLVVEVKGDERLIVWKTTIAPARIDFLQPARLSD